MKANELRIGNLFIEKHCGETITVESISKERIGFSGEFYGKWQAEPIPITEEWLLRFGFEKREGSVSDSFYIGINPVTKDWMFDIVWIKNMMDYSYEDFPFYRNGHFKIQHVHQLQNLYFALTGKELKLNEK